MKSLIGWLALCVVAVGAQTATSAVDLRGRVLDAEDTPVNNVVVEAAGLDTSVRTNTEGRWALVMETIPTPILERLRDHAMVFDQGSGTIWFQVRTQERVQVRVTDMRGRMVYQESFVGAQGPMRFQFAEVLADRAGEGLFIINLQVGSVQHQFKYVHLHQGQAQVTRVLARDAVTDSLVFTRNGFERLVVRINNYIQNLGDLTLRRLSSSSTTTSSSTVTSSSTSVTSSSTTGTSSSMGRSSSTGTSSATSSSSGRSSSTGTSSGTSSSLGRSSSTGLSSGTSSSSGRSSSTGNSSSIVSSSSSSSVAANYTLRYTAGTGGTLAGTATQQVTAGSSGSEIVATPSAGYRFLRWSDDVATAARTDANVRANITVSAVFQRYYVLTPTASTLGKLFWNDVAQDRLLEMTAARQVDSGDSLLVCAVAADPGVAVDSLRLGTTRVLLVQNTDVNEKCALIKPTADRTVAGNFRRIANPLTPVITGTTGYTLRITQGTTTSAFTATRYLATGSTAKVCFNLTAGYRIVSPQIKSASGWGAWTLDDDRCANVLSGAADSVRATVEAIPSITVTPVFGNTPNGGVIVWARSATVVDTLDAPIQVQEGQEITFCAQPQYRFVFDSLKVNGVRQAVNNSAQGRCFSRTMGAADLSIVAYYTRANFYLVVPLGQQGGDIVYFDSEGIEQPFATPLEVVAGGEVVLQAQPDSDHEFYDWYYAASDWGSAGTGVPTVFDRDFVLSDIDQDYEIRATFLPMQYAIDQGNTANGVLDGFVAGKITKTRGVALSVTAQPNEGYYLKKIALSAIARDFEGTEAPYEMQSVSSNPLLIGTSKTIDNRCQIEQAPCSIHAEFDVVPAAGWVFGHFASAGANFEGGTSARAGGNHTGAWYKTSGVWVANSSGVPTEYPTATWPLSSYRTGGALRVWMQANSLIRYRSFEATRSTKLFLDYQLDAGDTVYVGVGPYPDQDGNFSLWGDTIPQSDTIAIYSLQKVRLIGTGVRDTLVLDLEHINHSGELGFGFRGSSEEAHLRVFTLRANELQTGRTQRISTRIVGVGATGPADTSVAYNVAHRMVFTLDQNYLVRNYVIKDAAGAVVNDVGMWNKRGTRTETSNTDTLWIVPMADWTVEAVVEPIQFYEVTVVGAFAKEDSVYTYGDLDNWWDVHTMNGYRAITVNSHCTEVDFTGDCYDSRVFPVDSLNHWYNYVHAGDTVRVRGHELVGYPLKIKGKFGDIRNAAGVSIRNDASKVLVNGDEVIFVEPIEPGIVLVAHPVQVYETVVQGAMAADVQVAYRTVEVHSGEDWYRYPDSGRDANRPIAHNSWYQTGSFRGDSMTIVYDSARVDSLRNWYTFPLGGSSYALRATEFQDGPLVISGPIADVRKKDGTSVWGNTAYVTPAWGGGYKLSNDSLVVIAELDTALVVSDYLGASDVAEGGFLVFAEDRLGMMVAAGSGVSAKIEGGVLKAWGFRNELNPLTAFTVSTTLTNPYRICLELDVSNSISPLHTHDRDRWGEGSAFEIQGNVQCSPYSANPESYTVKVLGVPSELDTLVVKRIFVETIKRDLNAYDPKIISDFTSATDIGDGSAANFEGSFDNGLWTTGSNWGSTVSNLRVEDGLLKADFTYDAWQCNTDGSSGCGVGAGVTYNFNPTPANLDSTARVYVRLKASADQSGYAKLNLNQAYPSSIEFDFGTGMYQYSFLINTSTAPTDLRFEINHWVDWMYEADAATTPLPDPITLMIEKIWVEPAELVVDDGKVISDFTTATVLGDSLASSFGATAFGNSIWRSSWNPGWGATTENLRVEDGMLQAEVSFNEWQCEDWGCGLGSGIRLEFDPPPTHLGPNTQVHVRLKTSRAKWTNSALHLRRSFPEQYEVGAWGTTMTEYTFPLQGTEAPGNLVFWIQDSRSGMTAAQAASTPLPDPVTLMIEKVWIE